MPLYTGRALVRVDYGGICKADIRYYLGGRDSRVLGLKYPLSLIHEATGTVLRDATGRFSAGDKVAFVPNLTHCSEECSIHCCKRNDLLDNYCPSAYFASSNCDGFSKEIVSYPPDNLIKLSECASCYVFSELISVAIAALRRANVNKDSRIAVYGDGILGFILCSVIRAMYDCVIFAVGKHQNRLDMFSMCDAVFLTDGHKKKPIGFNIGFECVGGMAASYAINSITDLISVGGDIVLLGVSEEAVPFNTRVILEKGLTIKGSTRSCAADFIKAAELFKSADFRTRIEQLIIDEIKIRCIEDYYFAFETECASDRLGKYVLAF